MDEQPKDAKVIDLAAKRKRQAEEIRRQAKANKPKLGFWQYLQFFAFLAVLALMLQYCNHGI